jgi:hypothetical protein
MSDNKRAITLEPHSVGDLLTEVARAHLHGGLPSTMIKRMKEGVDKYREEVKDSGSAEAALASYLSGELEIMYDTWRKKEDSFYGM